MLHDISTREKVIVMLAVMSGLFLVALDQSIVATALGAIVNEFKSYSSLGFVVTAYLLTSVVLVPVAGKLSDMYGRRPMLLIGVSIFVLGSWLSAIAQNIEWLIAARGLQGVGGGFIMANAFTIIGDLFTPRERGKWQGIIGAVFGLSSLIGPLLGGWLTDHQHILGMVTDWRWNFYINIPIGIVAAYIIWRYCPTFKHPTKNKLDIAGAVLITTALSALILAVDNTDVIFAKLIEQGMSLDTLRMMLWAVVAVSAAAFIAVERRAQSPIIPLRLFTNRTFAITSMVALLFGGAFLGVILYVTQFNQQVFGATASNAGLMLMPMVVGMTFTSIGMGQVVSRTGKYKLQMVGGLAVTTIAVACLNLLTPASPYWHEAIIMFIVGLGMGAILPVINVSVQNEFEQKDLGVATASIQLFRGLGSTIGTAVMSGVLTAGVLASFGAPLDNAYLKTLSAQPQAKSLVKNDMNADELLRINMMKREIHDGAQAGLKAAPLPPQAKQAQLQKLDAQQKEYSEKIINAFSAGLKQVFTLGTVLLVGATILTTFVRERKLRNTVHHPVEM